MSNTPAFANAKNKEDMNTNELITIEHILIGGLGLFVFILMGVALHLAKTIEQLRQYISELERDYRKANKKLMNKEITEQSKQRQS